LRFRSLASRFILTSVGATGVTFLLFIGVVLMQLERNLARQSAELERITDAKISEILDADLDLAAARLRFQTADIARRVNGIATRADTVAAFQSRNSVAFEAVLSKTATGAEVESIIAVDLSGNVLGASIPNPDLVGLGQVLRASPLHDQIVTTLSAADRESAKALSLYLPGTQLADFRTGARPDRVSQAIVAPVFDDFGDVIGGLVAQRWIRATEPILTEFAEITDVGVAVYSGERLLSRAAIPAEIRFSREAGRLTATAGDQQLVARCGPALELLTLCAFKPLSELFAAQQQVTRIGRTEGGRLIRWLIVAGILSGFIMSGAIAATALPITRPLRKLSSVVSAVARGDYDVTVDGTERPDEIGEISRAVLVLRDSVRERDNLRANIVVKNAELERQELELRNQNRLFDAALNNMSHGLCMFDRRKRLIVSNARYAEIFGVEPERIKPGLHVNELLALQSLAFSTDADETGNDGSDNIDPSFWPADYRSSITQKLTDGRVILTTRQPLAGGGWVVIFEDVTERQKARERLVYQARHDGLTGLPNRLVLREQMSARLDQLRQDSSRQFFVLCIDLDEFKNVNDTLGHPVGDLLLQQVAKRLTALAGDENLVVRLGGDEFALLTDLRSRHDIPSFAEQLIAVIGKPYDLDGQEVLIGASIGIATGPKDGVNPDELMKHADLALYRAKSDGRNTFRWFEPEMAETVRERQELITDLRKAIDEGELTVFFQPQVSLADNSIVGFEALVRWRHPVHGMVSPASFIPVAEETGIIVPIGEWVLRESCRHAAAWPIPVRVAVNISARQLRDRGFVVVVINALAATGLPATRLELEITESVLLQDNEETRATLLQLKGLGIKVAMDDFGTGYSSLSCLRSFPFDKIKIDQSFVRAMVHSVEASSIVSAIIELGENLGIGTTAEGIEDEVTMNILKRQGCREAQGYLIGRPGPPETAIEFLMEATARSRPTPVRRRA